MAVRDILQRNRSDIALVIGNGVNRHGSAKNTNSWRNLLLELSIKRLPNSLRKIPRGLALTEFFDLLELQSNSRKSKISLQHEFCTLLQDWKCHDHHKNIISWAKENKTPVLTTNFERVFGDAGNCSLHHIRRTGFTDYYPWETYYGTGPIDDPSQDFGVWHINGMEHYPRSIRLGLTHYMGSVERARGWIHRGNETRLYSGKNAADWRGAGTWLHVVFNNSLLFFGLGLDESEVFLRWLLIERARYFRRFPNRRKRAWYIHTGGIKNRGKAFFLEGVGIKLVRSDSYDEIYGLSTWGR